MKLLLFLLASLLFSYLIFAKQMFLTGVNIFPHHLDWLAEIVSALTLIQLFLRVCLKISLGEKLMFKIMICKLSMLPVFQCFSNLPSSFLLHLARQAHLKSYWQNRKPLKNSSQNF